MRLQFRVAKISNFSKAFSSVQFSSLLFSQNTIQYKNTLKGCKGAQEKPEGFMKPELPSLKEISKIK